MDTNEYLPMFVAECREHLQELNLAVVTLEQTPDDRERVDEVFRIAHSLKGMSATMGFAGMAELTHNMEDVFELLRQRRDGINRAAVDQLFNCLDMLSAAVDAIDETGEEAIDPEELIEELRSLVRQRRDDQPPPDPPLVIPPGGHPDGPTVTVTLDDDVQMPAVRAYMVLGALADLGRVVVSLPAESNVDEFTGRVIEVVLETDHEDDTLVKAAQGVEGVATVAVIAANADGFAEAAAAPPAPAPAEAPAAPELTVVPDADDDDGIEPLPVAEVTEVAEPAAAAEPTPAAEPAPAAAAAARKPAKKGMSTVRVEADRLDQLMGVMGELVVHRTQLEALVAQSDVPGIAQAMQELNRSSQALRAMVMQVRMIEVEAVFLRLPRLVRDLSSRLGKEVDLQMTGTDTELDRTVVDALGDPLVHLVRNALDHGLESTEERVAAGKPPVGVLEIGARHAGGSVVITVRDDGRGVNPEAVAKRAVARGLISASDQIDMQGAIELLFAPGFSTMEAASDISGRGVGMDAVRATVQGLGGEVTLSSVLGEGTTTQLRLPLTLAIVSALLVQVAGRPFAVPLDRVERTLRLEDHPVRSAAGRRLLVVPDGVLPIVDGDKVLDHGGSDAPTGHAVIVRAGEQRVALAVEHLIGQHELVTRALPPELSGAAAISGGAVLSDGGIALIVDCDALAGSTSRVLPPSLLAA
jgi:two-component system chemotaxis sensor kinase CheA